MTPISPISPGQILTGSRFNEPMRVETLQANGPASRVIGLVGMQSGRFRPMRAREDSSPYGDTKA